MDGMIYFLDVSINAVNLIALICTIGAFTFRFFILPINLCNNSSITRKWKFFLIICLSILTLSSFFSLIIRSIAMNGGDYNNINSLLSIVLLQTHFGHIQLIRIGLIIILWFLSLFISFNKNFRINITYVIAFFCLLIIVWTTSAVSHAAHQGDFTIKIFVDALHVFSAALWIGSVIAFVLCLFPFYIDLLKQPLTFFDLIDRLSFVSTIGLILILFTGAYNAFWMIGSFDALLTTSSGLLLITKLSFVFALILIGIINKFIFFPKIDDWANNLKPTKTIYYIKASLIVDVFLGLIILTLTAFLIHAAPPGMM